MTTPYKKRFLPYALPKREGFAAKPTHRSGRWVGFMTAAAEAQQCLLQPGKTNDHAAQYGKGQRIMQY
jgi:hypothetical protein